MLILAVDTTTRRGSLALTEGQRLVASCVGDETLTHAERLPTAIGSLLESAGARLGDVELFAVAAGPGSFTGLRVGIATVQGLAFSTGRPVAAVPVLDALALVAVEAHVPHDRAQSPAAGAFVGALMDAHRGEVFSALWWSKAPASAPRAAPPAGRLLGELDVMEPPGVAQPEAVLARWASIVNRAPVRVAGDGALVHRDLVSRWLRTAQVVAPLPPLAPAVARLAGERAQEGGAGPPHAVRPVYVRRPDAELDRERRAGRSGRSPDRLESADVGPKSST